MLQIPLIMQNKLAPRLDFTIPFFYPLQLNCSILSTITKLVLIVIIPWIYTYTPIKQRREKSIVKNTKSVLSRGPYYNVNYSWEEYHSLQAQKCRLYKWKAFRNFILTAFNPQWALPGCKNLTNSQMA